MDSAPELARELARELVRGHKRLLLLIDYALGEGWEVRRSCGGHLEFIKPGLPTIYIAGNHHAVRSAHAMLQQKEHRQSGPAGRNEGGRREDETDG